jgi:predicted MFS family arabinose efflux permease
VRAIRELVWPPWVSPDGRRVLAARAVRNFAYGFLSVLLGIYLEALGYTAAHVGGVLMATLAGSALLSLLFAAVADRWGRRRVLAGSAGLMVIAGATYALGAPYPVLLLAALTGTLGATAGEIGPFLSLEQAILPQTCPGERRTQLFSIYNLQGAVAWSLGALCAGLPALLEQSGMGSLTALRLMFAVYAALALLTLRLFARLSPEVEVNRGGAGGPPPRLHRSRRIVIGLSALFGLDSLGGGFIVQSLIAFWFYRRWGAGPEVLGPVFMAAGILQAVSFLVAARVADRIGLLNTMVFTHLPSNVLMMLIPAMPSLTLAVLCLLARQSLSQMDVPTRQSYIMAVVEPEERTAASSLTNVARNIAQSLTPGIAGYAMDALSLGLPMLLGGGLKVVYDLLLLAAFRHVKPPEER